MVQLEDLVDQLGIGRILEVEERADDVEARLVKRADARPAGLDIDQSELRQRPQALPDGSAMDTEALDQLPLGRQAISSGGLAGRAKNMAITAQKVSRPVTRKLIRYDPVESKT